MAKKSSLFSEDVILPHCQRPGVIVYLEDWDAVSRATTQEQRGLLMDAVISYVRYGEVPDFSTDPCLSLAWGFLSPKLDRDQDDYDLGIWTRRYNAYKRNEKEPLEADQWLRAVTGRNGPSQYEYEYESVSESANGNEYESGNESANEKVSASEAGDGDGGGKGKGIAGKGQGEPSPPPPPLAWGTKFEPMTNNDFERQRRERMQAVAGYQ